MFIYKWVLFIPFNSCQIKNTHINTLNGPKFMPRGETQHGILISGIPKLNLIMLFPKDKFRKDPL